MRRPSLNRPLRLALVVGQLREGGTERQVHGLAEHFDRARVLPHVVCTGGEHAPYAERIRSLGVGVSAARGGRSLIRRARWLEAELERLDIDVIHSLGDPAGAWAALANLRRRLPHVHSIRSHGRGAARAAIRRIARARADVLTVNARALASRLGLNDAALTPNGVDIKRFDPCPPLDDGRFKILYAGRSCPDKDLPTLVSAMRCLSRAPARNPSTLTLVGPGLAQVALSLAGLPHLRVQHVGPDPGVERWLARSDVLVLSSRREGMPNVVLEAMAAARPVVATDAGGSAEAIIDDVTGRVVPTGQPPALAAALGDLGNRPDERREMGKRGRARATQAFSFDRACRAMLRSYLDSLDRNRFRRLADRHVDFDPRSIPHSSST